MLHHGSNCSPSRAMDGHILCHGIISSCQSAATSEIVKRCCSSLVRSAIAGTQTFYQPLKSEGKKPKEGTIALKCGAYGTEV